MSYPPRPSGWSFVTTRISKKLSSKSFLATAFGFSSRKGENECGQHGLWFVVEEKGCLSKKERGLDWQKKKGA